jgi:iron complex transport system substrate-binding protein
MGARGFEPRYAGLSARSSHSSSGRGASLRRPIFTGDRSVTLTGARWSARLAYAPSEGEGLRGGILFAMDGRHPTPTGWTPLCSTVFVYALMSLNARPPDRRTVPVALLAVAVLISAGVAIAGTVVYFDLRPGPAPQAPGLGPNRTTIVDDLGRTVRVPLNPSRVVVLAPSIMDFVYRMGLRDRVVGIGCTVGDVGGIANEYSPNQTSLWNLSASMCITDYPSLDTAGVALLEPQLVLASTLTSVTDVTTLTAIYGLPVVLFAPSTMEGIVGDARLMVEMFPSNSAAGTSLEADLEQALVNATNFDAGLSTNGTPIPSVLITYGFYSGEYYTYGPGTFGQSIVDLAGGDSISAGIPIRYAGLNASAVLLDQPDVILYGTSWNDPYLVSGQTPSVWASSAPYWSQLNGSKIPVDVTLVTEPDPTMVLALPWFLHDLHPTLVPAPTQPPP